MAKGMLGRGGRTPAGLVWSAVMLVALLAASGARAQSGSVPTSPPPHSYDATELEQLVGRIALYADDLVGIVLPASAYPLQIVEAVRFLDARAKDPTLTPDDDWDDAVVALLNYPEVLRMMNEDLDWTADLGEAFVYQQADVLDAVQRFRERARSAGNLHSDDRQTVTESDGAIEIAPANPQVVYVPYYEPERVVSYYAGPALDYYPYAYPVYYYPYPNGYAFNSGFFWGVTTAFVVGWDSHHVRVCPYDYSGHPYYGYRYHDPYYARRASGFDGHRHRDGNDWRPREHWGARPRHQFHEQDGYLARPPRRSGGDGNLNSFAGSSGERTFVPTRDDRGNAGDSLYRRRGTDSRGVPPAGVGDNSRWRQPGGAPVDRRAEGSIPRTVRGMTTASPVVTSGQNAGMNAPGVANMRAPVNVLGSIVAARFRQDRANASAPSPPARTSPPAPPPSATAGNGTRQPASGPAQARGAANSGGSRGGPRWQGPAQRER